MAGINTWNRGGSLPEEAEDGLLTAEDVAGMDLSDTELGLGHLVEVHDWTEQT